VSQPRVTRLIPQPAVGGPFEEFLHMSSFAIINKGNKLLLEKRLRPEFSAGKWVIPAAVINYGEDPSAAVKRVVKEQLGTDAKEAELIDVESYDDKHWDICFVYKVEIPNVGTLSPDVEKTDYFELLDLPPELRDDHKEVIDTLKARKRV
jgi:ADP-ribose pyrophosphatase YjhB (NUDIX family)